MQTFLPYESFTESAKSLDYRRLGKQRVEAWQILRNLVGLTGNKGGWSNHPAVLMWRGSEEQLTDYALTFCAEWIRQGYNDTLTAKINDLRNDYYSSSKWGLAVPEWLGDDRLHTSHKSNLIRKLPDYYGPMWPDISSELPYYWPVRAAHLTNSF